MTRSKREIPHYYLSNTIEIQNTLGWLASQNADRSLQDRVLLPALLIKAVGMAAEKIPGMDRPLVGD